MSYENEMILQMKLSWDIVHILGQKILGGWGCGYIHLGATSSNNEIWIEILKDYFFFYWLAKQKWVMLKKRHLTWQNIMVGYYLLMTNLTEYVFGFVKNTQSSWIPKKTLKDFCFFYFTK